MSRKLKCSFCGSSEDEVDKLVAGRRAYICDRCVSAATDIMNGRGPSPPRPVALRTPWARVMDALKGAWRRPSERRATL